MKGGEDEAIVPGLPEELDVGRVGDARNWDAVAVLGGGTEGLGHLLPAHAPVGGHEGGATQEQRHDRLDEGEARGAYSLQERHHAGVKSARAAGRMTRMGNICECEQCSKGNTWYVILKDNRIISILEISEEEHVLLVVVFFVFLQRILKKMPRRRENQLDDQ